MCLLRHVFGCVGRTLDARYVQRCLHFRRDVQMVDMAMLTYKWFVPVQGANFPGFTWPGTHYHPYEPAGFSMRGLLAGRPNEGFTHTVRNVAFSVQGSGFRVQGSGFRVQGSGFRIQGSGFRQSARIPYLSKSDEIGTKAKLDEIEGQKRKCVLRYTDFLLVRFDTFVPFKVVVTLPSGRQLRRRFSHAHLPRRRVARRGRALHTGRESLR